MLDLFSGDDELLASNTGSSSELMEINQIDQSLKKYFDDKMIIDPFLTRPLVSFQANKTRPVYRWYKYKEAFSASLVEHFLQKYSLSEGIILDPFAGSGTTLFAASAMGINAVGIELLPIGQQIIATKNIIESEFTSNDFDDLKKWSASRVWEKSEKKTNLPELRITKGAYPEKTKEAIEKYLAACILESHRVQAVLHFALFCTLESISFTRKDGQYLRWDYRAGRKQGKKIFNKGQILGFDQAISNKINEIIVDLISVEQPSLFSNHKLQGNVLLHSGSCLDLLPSMPDCYYDAIITSPPYCNRYDYTRTYALELALLNTDEKKLAKLRQEMLSCTVENRAKDLLKINPLWTTALDAANNQNLLQVILKYLDDQKAQGTLNNSGIPRMVKGYFYELACIIAESSRVLKPDAPLIMVNDNVRYAGASISVDLILSSIAKKLGFRVENILILPNGKGNSSQQMGEHGRDALRKCVYVWRKL
ncbi:MAG: site-specific DNA-methyltransferase [Candidatus Contendobacter sp.]|nr:site-specific DNA-methyltransferase [Candidatus Contendobacter sp.]